MCKTIYIQNQLDGGLSEQLDALEDVLYNYAALQLLHQTYTTKQAEPFSTVTSRYLTNKQAK